MKYVYLVEFKERYNLMIFRYKKDALKYAMGVKSGCRISKEEVV